MLKTLIPEIYYHRLVVRTVCLETVRVQGWIGSVIRNNLLSAASQVVCEPSDCSLLELLKQVPLDHTHSLYKEMKEGFPAPYSIVPESHNEVICPVKEIKRGEQFVFSLILFGNASQHYEAFLQAVILMCNKGIGHPQKPFQLIEVNEQSATGEVNLLIAGEQFVADGLFYPVSLMDSLKKDFSTQTTTLSIQLLTPILLFKQKEKKNPDLSYQDKLNGFPSFYQFVRSSVHRLLKLAVLYNNRDLDKKELDFFLEQTEYYIFDSVSAMLISANIKRQTIRSTQKKEQSDTLVFSGYVGELLFEGNITPFVALLQFMEYVGIGNGIVYGMGRIKVKELL